MKEKEYGIVIIGWTLLYTMFGFLLTTNYYLLYGNMPYASGINPILKVFNLSSMILAFIVYSVFITLTYIGWKLTCIKCTLTSYYFDKNIRLPIIREINLSEESDIL